MRVAILTFPGFNEIDTFVAAYIINRMRRPGWKAEIACPDAVVESGSGVHVTAQRPLEFAREADAVLVGSGRRTAEVVADSALLSRLDLDPKRQLIGSQCSGALILARLGLLATGPACTDRVTRPLVEAAGVRVLEQPFFCRGNIATAGGCLSSHYLATWCLWRLAGKSAAEEALAYVSPVGEEEEFIGRALRTVAPFVEPAEQGPANQ